MLSRILTRNRATNRYIGNMRIDKIKKFTAQYPRFTMTISNCILGGISDVIAQTATLQEDCCLDLTRVFRFVMFQGLMAPLVYNWLLLLEKLFPFTGTRIKLTLTNKVKCIQPVWKQLLKRVFTDQLIFAPVGSLLFFIFMAYFEGIDISEKLQNTYLKAVTSGWKVWPLVQLVNLYFVPLILRLPFISMVGIAWNSYLSYLNTI